MPETIALCPHELSTLKKRILAHLPRLERNARALLRGHSDAADLVQDTMERALRALPRLRSTSNLAAWLNTLLHNRFIDWVRRADRRALSLDTNEVPAPLDEPADPPPFWLELSDRDVRAAIDRLPARAATILRMRLLSRMSYNEISRRLGISGDTVGTRLLRARRRLQRVLTEIAIAGSQPTIERLPPAPGAAGRLPPPEVVEAA